MITPVAHSGHWLASFTYLAPLRFLVDVIRWGTLKDRRARRHGAAT
jgi:hypothetical protein